MYLFISPMDPLHYSLLYIQLVETPQTSIYVTATRLSGPFQDISFSISKGFFQRNSDKSLLDLFFLKLFHKTKFILVQ